MALDASAVVAIEDANSYDFLVNTFDHPGRAARRAGDERQHRRRGARLELVPESCRAGRDDGRSGARARPAGRDLARRLGRERRQVHRRAAGFPDDRSAGPALSDRVRSAVQPRDGQRRRDDRHRLLPRLRLSRGRGLPGGARPVDGWCSPTRRRCSTRGSAGGARCRGATSTTCCRRGARLPNGNYRVLVSRFASGKPLGNFRYYGTRPDDPNDIVRARAPARAARRARLRRLAQPRRLARDEQPRHARDRRRHGAT